MPLKVKKKCLADKINALLTTTPAAFGSDDEVDDTAAKVVEHYDEDADSNDDLQHSKIRRQNVETLDQVDNRYAGKKVSRKDIYSDSDNDESDENEDAEDSEEEEIASMDEDDNNDDSAEDSNEGSDIHDGDESIESSTSDKKQSDDSENQSEESSDEEQDEEDDEDKEYGVDIDNPLYRNRDNTTNFKTMSDTNVKADIEKGNCVRNQLKLWENLLEMRIKLQKCVITGNQMPQCDTHKDYRNDIDFMKKTNETRNTLTGLLNNLLDLQDVLLKQYPETRNLNTGKNKRKLDELDEANDSMDEEIPSDTEDENDDDEETELNKNDENSENELEGSEKIKQETPRKKMKLSDYDRILQQNHQKYASYRDSVIQKWNEKTRIATGKLNKGMTQTTLKQIEFALSDKPKLRKRTQLKRSEYTIVGKPEAIEDENGRRVQEYDPEIFDDDDFYHQLLRDLIEYKSSDITDPIQLSKQWIQLQNMRSKMKRKIDTRATKGRRIRYNVHNKLVNFMAPITVEDTWTDHAKNELYNSLFGKIKPLEEVTR